MFGDRCYIHCITLKQRRCVLIVFIRGRENSQYCINIWILGINLLFILKLKMLIEVLDNKQQLNLCFLGPVSYSQYVIS